jgi:hypothetical protein
MRQHWHLWWSSQPPGAAADALEIFSALILASAHPLAARVDACLSLFFCEDTPTLMLSRMVVVSLCITGLAQVCAIPSPLMQERLQLAFRLYAQPTQLQSTATSSTAQLDTPDRVTTPLHSIYLLGGRSTARVRGVPPSHGIDCGAECGG